MSAFRELDGVLRGEVTTPDVLAREGLGTAPWPLVRIGLVLAALYGACMGVFGLFRADGMTPRPAYDYLKNDNPNAEILKQPKRTVDVEAYLPDGMIPDGYTVDYQWRKPWALVKNVPVDSLEPTVIKLKPAKKG